MVTVPGARMVREELRHRIEIEDALLNSRTTIFLGVNAVWLAAARIGTGAVPLWMIAVVGLLLSLVWLLCGVQSRDVIAALAIRYDSFFRGLDPVQDLVRETQKKSLAWLAWPREHFWRPTDLLGRLLPGAFVIVWAVLLVLGMSPRCGASSPSVIPAPDPAATPLSETPRSSPRTPAGPQ